MPQRHRVSRHASIGLVAVASIIALAACGDDDSATTTAATAPATTQAIPATPAPTAPPTTVAPAPTTEPTTEAPITAPPSSTTPTTIGGTGVVLAGATLVVVSPLMTNPFTLERVGEFGGMVVYDGTSVDGDFALRCVAVGHDGEAEWNEWCVLPGDSGSFVVVDGVDPWVVDVGPEPLDVTMDKQPSTWVVTSSGCNEPLVTLIDAAELAPAVATGIACVADEAFMTYSSVYMQPGPADGGGLLLTNGDEGWNSSGGGTSFDCSDWPDGVDRCQTFGVDDEMFDAVTPLPPPDLIAPQEQFVAVREVTDDAREMAGDAPDVDAITDAIVAAVTPTDPEVPPTMVRHDGVSFDQYSLLVIDVPLLDDSTRSTTWAVWITTATPEVPAMIHKAYAWNNCARGVADPENCV